MDGALKTLTLDDLSVGQIFESETYTLTDDEIKSFARRYDPQPFHLDEEAAKDSVFNRLAGSGWLTAAISMRLLVSSLPIQGGLVGVEAQVAWLRPTRPGDVLKLETEIVEITPSRSRADRGTVTIRTTIRNQRGKPVQTIESKLVVPRRDDSV